MFKIFNNVSSSSYPILRSKVLLYLVTFIALFYILMLGMATEYTFIVIFVLVCFLTTFYSKNMIVVLLIGLAVTNILRLGRKATLSEGLDTMEGDKTNTDSPETPSVKAEAKSDNAVPSKPVTATTPATATTIDSANSLINKLSTVMNGSGGGKTDIASLQSKADELVSTQDKLMQNMASLGPLLEKAEGFLTKYEGLKGKLEGMRNLKQEMKTEVESMRNMKEGFSNISWR